MEKEQDDVVSVILEGGFPKRVHEKHILHPRLYGEVEDMQQAAADTMHMYCTTWSGRFQRGHAIIHLAAVAAAVAIAAAAAASAAAAALLPPLPLPSSCLLSITCTRIRFLSFPCITDWWSSGCWKADAAFSLGVLFLFYYYYSYLC